MAKTRGIARASLDERIAFLREFTALAPVPFVPEIRIYAASEVTPMWRATATWLEDAGADVPFWSTPWAGGQALARFVLDEPSPVRGKRVVDVGSGSGLVAIACAMAGASNVRALDIDPLAEAACVANAEANGVVVDAEVADALALDPAALEADVIVCGDLWYERPIAKRLEPWLAALAARGVTVLTADPGRSYPPKGARELARYEVPTSVDLESLPSRLTRVLTF